MSTFRILYSDLIQGRSSLLPIWNCASLKGFQLQDNPPVNGDILVFNGLTNIWEYSSGTGATPMKIESTSGNTSVDTTGDVIDVNQNSQAVLDVDNTNTFLSNRVFQVRPDGTNTRVQIDDTTISVTNTLQYQDGNEAVGFILQSDASGNSTWVDPTGLSVGSLQSTTGNTSVDTSGDVIDVNQNSQAVLDVDNTNTFLSNRVFQVRPDGTNTRVQIDDTTTSVTNTLQYQDGNEAVGFILQSDASGNSTWVDPTGLSVGSLQSTTGNTSVDTSGDVIDVNQNSQAVLDVDNTNTFLSNRVFQVRPDGTNTRVQIDDTTTSVTNTLQYQDGNEAVGFILQSDASGNSTWVDPTGLSVGSLQSTTGNTSVDTSGDVIDVNQNSQAVLDVDNTNTFLSNRVFQVRPDGTNTRVQIDDTTTSVTNTLQYQDGNEAVGFILQSDASGNSTWVDPAGITPTTIQSTTGNTSVDTSGDVIDINQNSQAVLDVDNTNTFLSNRVFQVRPDGTNTRVQIDDTTTSVTNTLQYQDGNEAVGFILQSDASGNSTWVDPAGITPTTIQSTTGNTSVDTSGDVIDINQNSQAVLDVDNTNTFLSNRVFQVRPDGTNTRVQITDTTTTISNTLTFTNDIDMNTNNFVNVSDGTSSNFYFKSNLATTYSSTTLPAPVATTIGCARIGNIVSVTFPVLAWTGTGTPGTLVTTSAVDAAFRPSNDFFLVIRVRTNTTRQVGLARLGMNGIMTFWSSVNLASFAAGPGSNQIDDQTFVFTIA